MAYTPIDTDNAEFQNALKLIQYTRQSVFLTGKAGTGKSTFLKHVCQITKKKFVVLAPTGIAAINAGGSTLHSFFKLPFYPLLPDDPNFSLKGGKLHSFLKYSSDHRKLIKNIELVIIDEISMVRADIIDFIDKVLRVYSQNMREPFGGKQLLLVGDAFQLEPVVKSDEREIINRFYPNPYFFSARVFREMELVAIELTKVYRQTDKVFVNVLDHIRTNTAGAADLQLLNTRYNAPVKASENDMYITLATRRDNVDYINERRLAELPGEAVTLQGEIHGEFPESSLPTLMELTIKPGAQIIFIKNDSEKRWVNGTIGTISGIDADGIIYVITEDGKELDVHRESWSNIRYRYNEEEKKIVEPFYTGVFKVICFEIYYTGKSTLLEFCKASEIDKSFIERKIKTAVDEINFEKYPEIEAKYYEIKRNGSNSSLLDNDFLKLIEDETSIYLGNTNKYMCIITNSKEAIGVMFNKKGLIIKKSSLIIDEENEVLELAYDILNIKIDYQVNRVCKKMRFVSRSEGEKKKKIISSLNHLLKINNYELIRYIYYDVFLKEEKDVNKIYDELINVIDKNETIYINRINSIFELISNH